MGVVKKEALPGSVSPDTELVWDSEENPALAELLDEQSDETFIGKLDPFDPQEEIGMPGGTHKEPIKHEAPFERRVDNREVDKGFLPEEAVGEASRCLRCYRVVTYAYGK